MFYKNGSGVTPVSLAVTTTQSEFHIPTGVRRSSHTVAELPEEAISRLKQVPQPEKSNKGWCGLSKRQLLYLRVGILVLIVIAVGVAVGVIFGLRCQNCTSGPPSPSPTASISQSNTLSGTVSRTSTQSATQSTSESATLTSPSSSPSFSPSPTQTPTPTNTIEFRLQAVFASGASAPASGPSTHAASFTPGNGLVIALILLRKETTLSFFERFVGFDELNVDPASLLRVYSTIARVQMVSCFQPQLLKDSSALVHSKIAASLSGFSQAPTISQVSGITAQALVLPDSGVHCIAVGLTAVNTTARFTWGLSWSPSLVPCITTQASLGTVTACLRPFGVDDVGADPVTGNPQNRQFLNFEGWRSQLGNESFGSTAVTTTSQIFTDVTSFPTCQAQATEVASTCTSPSATDVEFFLAYQSLFCFHNAFDRSNNLCSTTPALTTFGCFCDDCCKFFGDCCSDFVLCIALRTLTSAPCNTDVNSQACRNACT